MSVLTKIFVVLLVVLSLLLSAATITFVNAVDDYTYQLGLEKTRSATLEAKAKEAETKAAADKSQFDSNLADANDRLNKLTSDAKANTATMAGLGTTAAAAESRATIAEGNVNKLSAAIAATEAGRKQLQEQVTALRTENDRLQGQNGDLNVGLADATNKLLVTEAERRNTAETLTELRAQLDKVSAALRDRGVDPNRITTSGLAAGAPPINGIVRNTREINGIPHAQISIGSDDAVKVGMEFTVLDKISGKFLGKMVIVAVEPSEAIGRLAGPDITAIAAGAEVRTQL